MTAGVANAGPPLQARVRPEWVDYNGHMNVAYYVLIFDQATDAALDRFGLGEDYRRKTGCSVFVGEMRVRYLRELREGEAVEVMTRLLGSDEKRVLLFHEMRRPGDGRPAADTEVLCLHVDLGSRRTAVWPREVQERLASAVATQRMAR